MKLLFTGPRYGYTIVKDEVDRDGATRSKTMGMVSISKSNKAIAIVTSQVFNMAFSPRG
jgi:hypothetical protein